MKIISGKSYVLYFLYCLALFISTVFLPGFPYVSLGTLSFIGVFFLWLAQLMTASGIAINGRLIAAYHSGTIEFKISVTITRIFGCFLIAAPIIISLVTYYRQI